MGEKSNMIELNYEQLYKRTNFWIFGAHQEALNIVELFKRLNIKISVLGILVSSMRNNPKSLDGIPVTEIQKINDHKNDPVLICTCSRYTDEIVDLLERNHFQYFIPLSNESQQRQKLNAIDLFNYNNEFMPLNVEPAISVSSKSDINISLLMVKSSRDKVVHYSGIEYLNNIRTIQAGAAIDNPLSVDYYDNVGDAEISYKNRTYCELSALYWIWKNNYLFKDWIGIFHYRRLFDVSYNFLNNIDNLNIDVILPAPMPCYPNNQEFYYKYHIRDDWEIMCSVLYELVPEYQDALKSVEKCQYLPGFNMYLIRKSIFNDYCAFLFPILKSVEVKAGIHNDVYQNRYAGFLAERLSFIYFTKNASKYRIGTACWKFFS